MTAPSPASGSQDAGAFPVEPTWHRNREVKEYIIDKEGLVFHPRLQLLSHLNETALYIWTNCEGQSTGALVASLAGHFGVELETAQRHVSRTLELFSVSGFIETRMEVASA